MDNNDRVIPGVNVGGRRLYLDKLRFERLNYKAIAEALAEQNMLRKKHGKKPIVPQKFNYKKRKI
jgi:hypothetical protein